MLQRPVEGHSGHLQFAAHFAQALPQHAGHQVGRLVALGHGHVDGQGQEGLAKLLVPQQALTRDIGLALGIVYPAVLRQQLRCFGEVQRIGLHGLELVAHLLRHPLAQAVVAIHTLTVPAQEVPREHLIVEHVGKGLTGQRGTADVPLRGHGQEAGAAARVGGKRDAQVARRRGGLIDDPAFRHLVDEVDGAIGQLCEDVLILDLAEQQPGDNGHLFFVVALVVGVDLKLGRMRRVVIPDQPVGAGGDRRVG